MGDWQPIETAPKDGTQFLAFGGGSPREAFIYDDVKDWKQHIRICWRVLFEAERLEDAGDGLFRKVPHVDDMGWHGGIHFIPTHWRPLPEPPGSP